MNLESMLRIQGVPYEKHSHPTTYTAQALAEVEHVSGYAVAKPVVVKGATGFTMCVLPAPRHLNLERVAAALGEPSVRLATETEMANLFPDCELGAEPPIGALFGLATLADPQLQEDDYLIMQAGTHSEAIKLHRKSWERLCQPLVVPITTG